MFPPETKSLVVDDMKIMRKIVSDSLAKCGINDVVQAENGQKAWEAIEQAAGAGSPFQLILCDQNMPVMDGLQLLKKVRGTDTTKNIPFVFISANKVMEQQLLEEGAHGFLSKPLKPDTIISQLDEIHKKLG